MEMRKKLGLRRQETTAPQGNQGPAVIASLEPGLAENKFITSKNLSARKLLVKTNVALLLYSALSVYLGYHSTNTPSL